MRDILARTAFSTVISLSLFAAIPATATPINGSDTVGAGVSSTNETGGNLGTSTMITLTNALETFSVLAMGGGSFSAIPVGTTVPLGSSVLDLTSAGSFGFDNSTVGDFTPSAISLYDQTSTSLDIFLTGAFTPGSLFGAGATASLGASENLALTQTNGGVISLSGTFASPPTVAPTSVPEPITVSLFGAGLAGIAMLRRRIKRRTKREL